MRLDHRPWGIKRLQHRLELTWTNHFLRPQLEQMGQNGMIMKPWYLKIHGSGISFGDQVHVVTSRDRPVRLTTWCHGDHQGRVEIGDYALICPDVRVDSATEIRVGANTMLAAGVYLTDADWHGIYDRAEIVGKTAPVILGDNVWLGDSAIVCKGVTIGDNSIVGAGSVVTRSIPANVVAAGNPAVVVRDLDTHQSLRRREDLLADPGFSTRLSQLEYQQYRGNSWFNWLRTILKPSDGD